MRLLAELGAPVDERLAWTTRNDGGALFLAHALKTSEVVCDFRLAMPPDRSLEFYDRNELLASFPEATRARDFPYRIVVSIQQDGKPLTLTVVPDRLCAIKINSKQEHLNFAIELDTGSESVVPRSKKITKKATWYKKLIGYYHAFGQDKFRETWNFERMRVLTVTTSEVRIDNILRCQEHVTNGLAPDLFLYTTRERIEQHGILGPAWRSSKQDSISLVLR